MSLKLPIVYPITDTRISGLSHADQVQGLLAGGATIVQIREKHASPSEFYDAALKALKLTRAAGGKLIINDRVDIALALEADGVHLGQTDMPVDAARKLLGEDALIGISTHNPAQVQSAMSLRADYIAFGPVFGTSTKEHPDPAVGLDSLRAARRIAGTTPLVAIGGINFENVSDTLRAGADSVAVISSLLAPSNRIEENTRRMFSIAKQA